MSLQKLASPFPHYVIKLKAQIMRSFNQKSFAQMKFKEKKEHFKEVS